MTHALKGPNDRQRLGAVGETLAADELLRRGCVNIIRNVRTPHGQIDLIAYDGNEMIFVEVKTRRSHCYGGAAAAITPRVKLRLINSAREYLLLTGSEDIPWRIDVVCVTLAGAAPQIEIFQNAVSESDAFG